LILTENYAALPIMQQHLLKTADDAVVIFGSSFPNDQEYTQVKCKQSDSIFTFCLIFLSNVISEYCIF